jgi:hypothetical protein
MHFAGPLEIEICGLINSVNAIRVTEKPSRPVVPCGQHCSGPKSPPPPPPRALLNLHESAVVTKAHSNRHKSFSNAIDASIRFEAIEQVAPLSTAEEAPRAVRRSISPRHGRRVLRSASFHTNAIRSAQPESYPSACARLLTETFFFQIAYFPKMSREQELGLDRNRKKFDVREEYFVSIFFFWFAFLLLSLFFWGGI